MMRVSIAIIEYHCMNDVLGCVRAVEEHLKEVEYECIVISNSCYGEDVLSQYMQMLGTNIKLVNTARNLGYAGGVNTALRHSKSDYLYVLNPDCRIMDDKIVQLMREMDADLRWAITGPMVVDNNNVVQPSRRRFPKPWTFLMVRSVLNKLPGAPNERARYLMEDYDGNECRFVDWVSGGATIIKMSAIKEIGGMDERYFLYMEDVDWCRSAWEKNYKVAYWPHSCVLHAGQHRSISAGWRLILNQHVRWHLISMLKYFMKYRFCIAPKSRCYRDYIAQCPSCSFN